MSHSFIRRKCKREGCTNLTSGYDLCWYHFMKKHLSVVKSHKYRKEGRLTIGKILREKNTFYAPDHVN